MSEIRNEEDLHAALDKADNTDETNPALKEQLDDQCDPVVLDATRAARLNMLAKADAILAKADQGKKLDRRDMLFAIRELRNLCSAHEGLTQAIIDDLVQVVRRIEMMNVSIIQQNVGMTAHKQLLEAKGVFTEEELKEVWDGIVKAILAQQKKASEGEEESRIIKP
jgi:hypothetical protein